MKRSLLILFLTLFTLGIKAQDKLVGGDLSQVPAYEKAGDKWLDADGKVIADLLTYLRDVQGWNAVRLRLFVDPSLDEHAATCQDMDYVKAFGKRIKDAGMALLLDFHYSDTWSDPGQQKIPATWTDHSVKGLCKSIYQYSYESVKALIDAGAKPDYVQIGNEISYGLLWDTSDGKYPSQQSQYASAGYCPSWNSTYSAASAWPRTAALLDNASHGVHKAFADNGLDSAEVKIVVHTALAAMSSTSDNFFKHIRTAGFDNYDIIGLSYYPTEHGNLLSLGSMLTTITKDFPEKPVHIVETGYFNEGTHATDYDFQSIWPYTPVGQYTFLADLIATLKNHDNVKGLYYWMPEECGPGHSETVWGYGFRRGFWKFSSAESHSLMTTSTGACPISVLKSFLSEDSGATDFDGSKVFQNLDFESGDLTGWTKDQSWATMWPKDISSWASAEVYRGSYTMELWNASSEDGSVMSQGATVAKGRYTITCRAHADQDGFYLWANKKKVAIPKGVNGVWSVTTDAADKVLQFGIGTVASSTALYLYVDDFTVTYVGEAIGDDTEDVIEGETNTNYVDEQGLEYALWPESGTAGVVSGKKALGLIEDGVISIPSVLTIDETDYYVTYIGESAFADNATLTDISIGKSCYEILGSAFSGCYNLKSVTFPSDTNLGSIGSWAFYNTALESIVVPAGVNVIPEGCFSKCWALKQVQLKSEELQSIGKFAFSTWAETGNERCWSTFDEGFMIYAIEPPTIDPLAFNLEDVATATLYVHPNHVENEVYTGLGFSAVLPLTDANITKKVTIDGVVYAYWNADDPDNEDGDAHAGIVGYTKDIPLNFVVPDEIEVDGQSYTVTFINAWALQNAPIESIEVTDQVTDIFEGTFAGCSALREVVYWGDISSVGDFAFSNWADEDCLSKGDTPFRSIVFYSSSVPAISPRAFFSGDVATATLFVDPALVASPDYNALGFAKVLPVTDYVSAISAPSKDALSSVAVYDLSGRRVLSVSRKGVCIKNGKKMIAK